MPLPSRSSYTQKCRELIARERAAEVDEVRQLRESLSGRDLQARGVALLKLHVVDEEMTLGGRTVLHLERIAPGPLPPHRFRAGDLVSLEAETPRSGEEAVTGVVMRRRADRLLVALDREPEELKPPLRLDRIANDVTWRRLQEALDRLEKHRRGPASRIIDLAFGDREPREIVPEDFDPFDRDLDDSQRTAVAHALATPDLALLHGPPGTGKTTTLVELIRQEVARGHRVLASAPSNVAVDNIVERLAAHGVPLVRLGHPSRLLPSVLEHGLDERVRRSDDSEVVDGIRRELDQIARKIPRTRDREERRSLQDARRELRKEIVELERRTVRHVLEGAAVTLCTNVGAGDPLLGDREFDVAIIDEAGQALEAACWVPLLRVRRAVLAGDHRQLPPTIVSREAARDGLSVTLFERLHDACGDHLTRMLTMQYRMHETIMRWSSEACYGGRLEAHPSVAGHRLVDLEKVADTEDSEAVMVMIDTAGCDFDERPNSEGMSLDNPGEARLVRKHVTALIEAGLAAADIAVIAPYASQVQLLRDELGERWPELEIDSVDGFQGREKEAVVISTVRSNPDGTLGFLTDNRRLNVAVTRARRHVCVIGDGATLARDGFLEGLLDHLQNHGEYRTAWQYL